MDMKETIRKAKLLKEEVEGQEHYMDFVRKSKAGKDEPGNKKEQRINNYPFPYIDPAGWLVIPSGSDPGCCWWISRLDRIH